MARAGVAVIPEDRHDSGCVLDFTVAENMFIADPERVARRGLMDQAEMNKKAAQLIEQFDIVCSGPDAPMWSLSRAATSSGSCWPASCRTSHACWSPRSRRAGSMSVPSSTCQTQLRAAADGGVGVLLISTEFERDPRPR